jgi:hypothetical protein
MGKMIQILYLFMLYILISFSGIAQVVISPKGDKIIIDNSKWEQVGNNIFNKNSGNVGIGNAAPTAKLYIDTTGSRDGSAALKIRSPFSGLVTDSILTWNPADSSVRKITTGSLRKMLTEINIHAAPFYTLTADDELLIENTANAMILLPAVVKSYKPYQVKNNSNGLIRIKGSIDGVSQTLYLDEGDYIWVVGYNNTWYSIYNHCSDDLMLGILTGENLKNYRLADKQSLIEVKLSQQEKDSLANPKLMNTYGLTNSEYTTANEKVQLSANYLTNRDTAGMFLMPAGQKVYVIRTKCAALATITYGLVDLNKPLQNYRTIGSSYPANTDAYIVIKGGFSVGFNAGIAISTSLPNLMGYTFARGAIYQSPLGGTVNYSGSRACIQFWGK